MKSCKLAILIIAITIPSSTNAHPGNTLANGCHYCFSDCAKWNVEYGERHCHKEQASYDESKQDLINIIEQKKGNYLTLIKEYDQRAREMILGENKWKFKNKIEKCNSINHIIEFTQKTIIETSKILLSPINVLDMVNEANSYLFALKNDLTKRFENECSSVELTPKKIQTIQYTKTVSEIERDSKMMKKVCPRALKRFKDNDKMWTRVNKRIFKRFKFYCSR